MPLNNFQKLNADASKYINNGFSAFVSISSPVLGVNDVCIYYKTPSFKNSNHWITLYGDNKNGFSIGIVLNESELKKITKDDLKLGHTLYGAYGSLDDDLTFKKLNISINTSNTCKTVARKPAVRKTIRKPVTRKVKRA